MTLWLMRDDALEAYAASTRLEISAAQLASFEAQAARPILQAPSGGVATIPVVGPLTKAPDIWAALFGGGNTTYFSLIRALESAKNDASVQSVELYFDSPGGHIEGLFEALAAIEAFPKPMRVRAAQAASAAYALAAAAGPIEATSQGAVFGSIGVATSFRAQKDVVTLTSTEAPDKRPDLSTEEGKAVVTEWLDSVHDLYADAIARGRATTKDNVNASYGRGRVFLAKEAKERGLVDSIFETPRASQRNVSATSLGGTSSEKVMDLEQLKAQFPALYAQVFALGQAAEYDRVSAHLRMGEACGDLSIATKAVADKTPFGSDLVQAAYMAAGLNRRDIQARQGDTQVVEAALSGVDTTAPEKDFGDTLATHLYGEGK